MRRSLIASLAVLVALAGAADADAAKKKKKRKVVWPQVGACVTGSASPAGDWPLYGNDLTNSRNQKAEKVIGVANAANLKLAWVGSGNSGNGTPVVSGNCVFTAGADGLVRALNVRTGALVWRSPTALRSGDAQGTLYGLSVDDGRVHVNVQYPDYPRTLTFDQNTGKRLWTGPPIEFGYTAWQISTATEFDGMVFQATTGPDADPKARPGYALLSAKTGRVLHEQSVIPTKDLDDGYAGGGIWTTAAVDTKDKYLYAGTANPYSKKIEHAYDNAIIKIDVNRRRKTFGQVVGSYKGSTDQVIEGLQKQPACDNFGELPVSYHPSGFSIFCVQLDVDFGASPQLVRNSKGRLLVVELQKTGVLHAVDADTMKAVWSTTVGTLPPETAGNAGSTATDGRHVFAAGMANFISSVDIDTGKIEWIVAANGASYHPLTYANGVLYSFGAEGTLMAIDAATGTTLHYAIPEVDIQKACSTVTTAGGIAVAHNTLFVNCDGYLLAYRLDGRGSATQPAEEPPPASGGGDDPGAGGEPGAGVGAIIAPPAGNSTGFATPLAVSQAGSAVTFVNADPTAQHDVTAADKDAGGRPIFQSKKLAAGGSGAVYGTERLKAGSYGFLCSIHPNMKGTLTVS